MKYEKTKSLREKEFRRLTGVQRKTFDKMLEILKKAEEARRRKGGHESKLSIEEMLHLALEYLREYRTYFHIAQDYGVHETTAMRIHKWVENVVEKDGTFSLSGKKALLESNIEYEVIQIDATESPVERQKNRKRNKKVLLRQEETPYYENASGSR
jgi:hypothetical protein